MRILIMAIGFLFALMTTADAAVYQQGVVYVIYDEEGDAAIADKADINSNGVPDVIEDVATQVNAARELFKDVFKYPDPLESERFKNVTSIEIDIEPKANMRSYGNAFSGVRKSKHDPNERAIHIRIANTIQPNKQFTPEHEYFHLIQYGATYFRNGWFLEGMARWSQDAISKTEKYPDGKDIPFKLKSKAAEDKIFQGKYNAAEKFWYPLAVNMKDKAKIPDRLMKKYKYVDGSPVFKDNIIYGANVMRDIIFVMKSKEDMAAAEFGGVKEWRKNGQRNDQNSKYILESVKEVYNAKK